MEDLKKKRCMKVIIKNKKYRRCSRKTIKVYCKQHANNKYCLFHDTEVDCIGVDVSHGLCCFCMKPCNPCSQAHSRCVIIETWR